MLVERQLFHESMAFVTMVPCCRSRSLYHADLLGFAAFAAAGAEPSASASEDGWKKAGSPELVPICRDPEPGPHMLPPFDAAPRGETV